MQQVDLLGMIANLGFPIAITAYLLLRFENKLVQLSEAINELKDEIRKHKGEI